jgi:hypothetical protein
MRRVVRRTVENMVAKKMLAGTVSPGSAIDISLEDIQAVLDKKKQADEIVDQVQASSAKTELSPTDESPQSHLPA